MLSQLPNTGLNEAQALLVCVLSRTQKAKEVRAALIYIFMAWRRGDFQPTAALDPATSQMITQGLASIVTMRSAASV